MNFGDRRKALVGVRRTIGHYEYRNRWFWVHLSPLVAGLDLASVKKAHPDWG